VAEYVAQPGDLRGFFVAVLDGAVAAAPEFFPPYDNVPGFPGKITVEVFHEAGEISDIAGTKQQVLRRWG
jgi:hypothetical protein